MATLRDIRGIINPIPDKFINDFSSNMDNILENLIVYDNIIYNPYILNHIINYNKENDTIINSIKKHLLNKIKNQKFHFRELNKKNKLYLSDFVSFFDKMYKLLIRINSIAHSIISNTIDSKKKWGTSIFSNYTIENIIEILCEDIIFQYALRRNIKENTQQNISNINHINMYMNIFSEYSESANNTSYYQKFGSYFDSALVNNIPSIEYDIKLDILQVYNFNAVYKYYMDACLNYKYIINSYDCKQIKNHINNLLESIIYQSNIEFIKNFIITYKKELINLTKFIDISVVLSYKKPKDMYTFISYYSTLYEISQCDNTQSNDIFKLAASHKYVASNSNMQNSVFNSIVLICAKEYIDTFFNTTESIEYFVNIINSNIINKKNNGLYYYIGANIKNKDEFIVNICQKFMERIIYTKTDEITETINYNALKIKFENDIKYIYKYTTIYEDYIASIEFNNHNKVPIIDNIFITSYDCWKINYKQGYIDKSNFTSSDLINSIGTIQNSYLKSSSNKKLVFYFHTGYMDINIGDSQLYILPLHYVCLEQFTPKEDNKIRQIHFDILYKKLCIIMNNYPENILKEIINSLIIGGVLINNNNILSINMNMNKNINLIGIFHTLINNTNNIKKSIQYELCLERKDIISANINHFVKVKDYTINELYDIIVKEIKLFDVSKELYQETIDSMISRDYISVDNGIIKKLVY